MLEELELIAKCKDGDVESFEMLISDYQKKVFNIAYRMTSNEQDAYDLSQEVFIRIYKSIKSFNCHSKLSTWIYRITINLCLDFLKKQKRGAASQSIDKAFETDDDEMTMQLKGSFVDAEIEAEKKELIEAVQNAINKLSKEHKAIIILRDINGFSYEEIEKILKISNGTVKSRISRARAELKNILFNDRELNIKEFV